MEEPSWDNDPIKNDESASGHFAALIAPMDGERLSGFS
jgi:hypothetical protein